MLANIFPPQNSLRNHIANALMLGPGSINDIKKTIKKNWAKSATYQGINKILKSLEEENVVTIQDHMWTIDKDWLKTTKNTLALYAQAPIYTRDMKNINFSTFYKAFQFFINNIDRIKDKGEDEFVILCENLAFFRLNKSDEATLKKFIKSNDCTVMVEKNYFINRLCAKYLTGLGVRVVMGIKRPTPYAIGVVGDTVFNIYLPSVNSSITSVYKTVKSMATRKCMQIFNDMMDDTDFDVKFTFETDPVIVKHMKLFLQSQIHI